MPQHDVIAALGHDWQFFAGLVGPHAEAEIADAALLADFLDLREVASGFGAGLVEVFQRRAGEFQLSGRFKADGPVGALQGDDVPAFLHRRPAELLEALEQIANAALLVIGRGAVIGVFVDQLFMLGADPPVFGRLFAADHRRDQLVEAFDHRIVGRGGFACAHRKVTLSGRLL